MTEVRNRCGKQVRVQLLRRKENKLDEALHNPRRQVGNIDGLLPRNVIPNQLIDFAMEAAPPMN